MKGPIKDVRMNLSIFFIKRRLNFAKVLKNKTKEIPETATRQAAGRYIQPPGKGVHGR